MGPADGDSSLPNGLLREDVTLRVWRWDGSVAARGKQRALDLLHEEWLGWPDPTLEVFPPANQDTATSVQFRIQATEDGRYVEHNRALFVSHKDGLIDSIDLYCGAPIFSAHRTGYIAPPTLSDEEVKAFLEESVHGWDVREWMQPNRTRHANCRIFRADSPVAHPASNFVGSSRWTSDEADGRIEEILEWHRQKGTGFTWWVMPFDTPADLCQRLEEHGLMLAGINLRMARLGLEDLSDIPVNEHVMIEDLDGSNDLSIETLLKIDAACFHFTEEQVDTQRPGFYERIKGEARTKELHCLAYLDGKPVGMADAYFLYGRVFLGGVATLPEYRGRRIYSTLLKHRLEAARERGYHLAAIDAGPMSKRVVEKYGFKEYGTVYVYGWMPEMDPEVIRSLVPDE
jgi:GNAT superfamily N-acetyltransferase